VRKLVNRQPGSPGTAACERVRGGAGGPPDVLPGDIGTSLEHASGVVVVTVNIRGHSVVSEPRWRGIARILCTHIEAHHDTAEPHSSLPVPLARRTYPQPPKHTHTPRCARTVRVRVTAPSRIGHPSPAGRSGPRRAEAW
jgi:hypothetical protein